MKTHNHQGTTMPTIEEKIQKLEEKLKQEKAKKARIEARKRAADQNRTRQEETRRKILLGAFFLENSDTPPAQLEIGGVRFFDWLTRDSDRALFDLQPRAENHGA